MAVSSATELKILVKTAGEQNLNRLSRQLEGVGKNTASADFKFDKFSRSLKRQEQQATKNISNLRAFSGAWRELASSVDIASKEFRQASLEADRLDRQIAKAQRKRMTFAGAAKGAGAVAAAGIFGGPEGAIGALAGLPFGPTGAAVGGAIGAQVGAVRQQLGGTAEYAAEIAKQRLALQLVTKEAGEYQRALEFVDQTSRKFAIPQEIITRQFTKLTASVKGAGGSVADAEKAFLGVAAGIRGTGGNLQDLDSALTATSQVFSKGKVSAEELRQQIGERLPGAFTLFAESLGMTPQELDKALEKGQVSLQDFQTFAEKLFKDYGKAAEVIASGPEAAGDRLQTALSRLSESVGDLLRPIGAAFQTEFAKIVIAIDEAAKKLADFLGLGKGRAGEIATLEKDLATTDERLRAFAQLRIKRGGLLGPVEYAKEQTLSQRRVEMAARLGGLRAAEKAAAEIKTEPPKGLPGIDTTAGAAKAKGPQDYSVQLANALIAASRELNPIKKLQLEYDAEILKINESKLKPEKKRVALNDAALRLDREREKLGKQMGSGLVAEIIKYSEREKLIAKTIEDLEIEAGIKDEAAKREIERTRLINELQTANRQLTEEELKRIDDAQARINQKTSETTKLLQQIGQNVITSIGDAFESLFTKAKSLRDIFADLLRQTARLILDLGLRAGAKALFPSLFAMGGVMTSRGPLPLKRYAGGGIANSPQLAMFGEGSTPEAYVPLPDGRSIPVKMKGGGDVGNIVVNVDATGSSVEGDGVRGDKLGEALGAAVRAELIRQKRPGGLLG